MARRKARKSAYIPPAHEIENKREKSARSTRTARTGRGGGRREPQPPSWGRVLRRLPIYLLMLFALQYALSGKQYHDQGARALAAGAQAAVVTLAFLPFMYYLERSQYRRFLQRKQRERDGAGDDA